MHRILIAAALFLTSTFIQVAVADPIAKLRQERCLPGIVTQGTARLVPENNGDVVALMREAPRNSPYCTFRLAAYAPLHGMPPDGVPMWSHTFRGPGLVFRHGAWQVQSENVVFRFEPVRLVPGVPYQQIVFAYRDRTPGNDFGYLLIVGFTRTFAGAVVAINVGAPYGLNYSVKRNVLTLTANPSLPCPACGNVRSIQLAYDRDVGNFAIVDPTPEKVELFKFIERFPGKPHYN